MRVIESQMLTAIANRQDWHKDNTAVILCSDNTTLKVELYGNVIAVIDLSAQTIRLSDGGWRSTTTKSRLNALCSHFGLPQIYQRKSVWYQGSFEWEGQFTWSLTEENQHLASGYPQFDDAVLGSSQNHPRPYDAVLGGLE